MFEPLHPLAVAVGGLWSGALLAVGALPSSAALALVIGIGAFLGVHLEVALRRRFATEGRA